MDEKFKYLSKTAQRIVHLIISLYILCGNNLQRYKAFTSSKKQPLTVNNIVGMAVQQSTAFKRVNLAASFSCSLKNKGLEMLTFLGEK